MKYLIHTSPPFCQTHESYAWRVAIGNTIGYGALVLLFIVAGVVIDSDDIKEYKGVPIGFGIYFIMPFCFNVALIIGLMKKNTTIIYYWIIFACMEGIFLSIVFIAIGIFVLTLNIQVVLPYGIIFIILGFVYYGSTYYIASIINTLRHLYINEQKREEPPKYQY